MNLLSEIRAAEKVLEENCMYYHARESECPAGFRLIMLLNGWPSPFVALNELLKVIERDEIILKRRWKNTGRKPRYRSRHRELMLLLQRYANDHQSLKRED